MSYNFLHLTLQEFFAAYHISQLGGAGVEVFKQYGKVERWEVVWRFVAGLTKFKDCPVDALFPKDEYVTEFFIKCLFEAQTFEHCRRCRL